MRIILLSLRLYFYGYFCDICANLCTAYVERNLAKDRPLNKKLLTFMSNFSNNILLKWQAMEKSYIKLCLQQESFWL